MLTPPSDSRDGSAPARDWVALTDAPLPTDAVTQWATTPRSGALVSFVGVVRDHADGRDGVHAMTYEAYEQHAVRIMQAVVDEARRRWTELERIAMLHRVGEVALSEPSVVVVVSSPHRDAAFSAARFCIDTIKETAPIWKQEHWTGGSDWAGDQRPITRVTSRVPSAVPVRIET